MPMKLIVAYKTPCLTVLLFYYFIWSVMLTEACVPTRTPTPITTTTVPSITTTTTLPDPQTTTTTTTTTTSTTTTTTTTPGTITTTTTLIPGEQCGPIIEQTLTSSNFVDGVLDVTYDSDECPTTALISCLSNPIYDLNAGIVVNGNFFVDYGLHNVTITGRYNSTDGLWYVSEERPLGIETIECLLTDQE